MNSTMNINSAVSINPLQTLLDEQKLLEPNLRDNKRIQKTHD